jgi:Ni,Fe-hydrogenase I cytochrome b subunit
MQTRRPISFLKNARKHILENETVRFLLFIEKVPKHRVIENISILFLAPLGIFCFVMGLAGFTIWQSSGLFGFSLYYVGVFITLLELLHCLFDK